MSTNKNETKSAYYIIREVATGLYCRISHDYVESGCAIPFSKDKTQAESFPRAILASNAIKRTYEARDKVRGSMLEDWPKMAPLVKCGVLEVEEIIEQ